MDIHIPGFGHLQVEHLVFDYNGTLAVDGLMYSGLKDALQKLPQDIQLHVITADTYGSVAKQLEGVQCSQITIGLDNQDQAKHDYVVGLGAKKCCAIGNGRNDHLMLQKAGLGVALLQEEGLATRSLLAADILCRSIFDVLGYFEEPKRLVATLRN